jgi:hypothetical protein
MVTTPAAKPKIRHPSDFTGDKSQAEGFIQEIQLYILASGTTYDNDQKRILLALSFLTGGNALAWKQAWVTDKMDAVTTTAPLDLGIWDDFVSQFKTAFSPAEAAATARMKLSTLQQTGDVEDYINEFRILASQARVTDATIQIEYFMHGLEPKLLDRILGMDTPPTDIAGWFNKATIFEANRKRAKAISARFRAGKIGVSHIIPHSAQTYPAHDPMAMDVDRLSLSERREHMKKGLCFVCHQMGHRASFHKGQGGGRSGQSGSRRSTPERDPRTGKFVYSKMRTMMAELPEDEKEEVMKSMEEEGF